MTDREKAIVMAHTGICMLEGEKMKVFYRYLEELYGRPVYTHEWLTLDIKERSTADFLELCKEAQPEPHWIPCSERLPEVKIGWDSEVNIYLVTVDDGAIYTDIDIIRKSGFDKYGSNVTAWMPLPEPYKGGDAE